MKSPASNRPSGQALQAIICLESSVKLWQRFKELLQKRGCAAEIALARAPETSRDFVDLCRRLSPALLALEDAAVRTVPLKKIGDLIARGAVQVLVFSDRTDDSAYEEFFREGCAGVLLPGVSDETLWKAISAVFAGEIWLPRRILSRLARETVVKRGARELTRRESDILELIRLGLTNQQIADRLFISRETVRWHVRSIYSKMGVDNRLSAIGETQHFGATPDSGAD